MKIKKYFKYKEMLEFLKKSTKWKKDDKGLRNF